MTQSLAFIPRPMRAPESIILHGQPVKRRAGFIVGTRLWCLAGGHYFDARFGKEAIPAICGRRLSPGRVCGATIFTLTLPAAGNQPRMTWVTDVDANIVTTIRTMSLDETLAYFGVSFQALEQAG